MNAKKQYGKGLSGFFVGLLLATAVIAGVLYFLNKSGKSSIKELPKVEHKASEPEILVPGSTASATSANKASQTQSSGTVLSQVASDTKASGASHSDDVNVNPDAGPASDGGEMVEDETTPSQAKPVILPKVQQQINQEKVKRQAQARRQAEAKKAAERARKQAKDEKQEGEAKNQPTPEQILNSGSVENARKEAQAEARKQSSDDAERQRAEDALNGRVRSESQNTRSKSLDGEVKSKGGKTIIQAGSYNNRQAADVQRNKLTSAGVSASVVEAEINGQPVYRVQTGVLSSSEAKAVRKKLQQRGINSFARSAK